MDRKVVDIYSMIYDDKTKENGEYLGKFEVLFIIEEDAWVFDFIGKNVNTDEICVIKSHEIKGVGGGIKFEVISITNNMIKSYIETKTSRPKVITLSGSMKYWNEFLNISSKLSSYGYIVLTPFPAIVDALDDTNNEKMKFYEELHKHRIDMSDMLFVINKDGYIGDNTQREIEYAESKNIPIEYLEEVKTLPVITLIGSGKFYDEFKNVEYLLTTLNGGAIVHIPSIFNHPTFFTNPELITEYEHKIYDKIHQQKMSSSDYVVVIDIDGYIGENTKEEIEYCKLKGIPVKSYMEVLNNE